MDTRQKRQLEKNLALAESASNYANEHIIESSTRLSTNAIISAEMDELKKPKEARIQPRYPTLLAKAIQLKDKYNEIDQPRYNIENEKYFKFKKTIEYIKESQIGDCDEFAIMALDYCLMHGGDLEVNMEVFHIVNGDHAFLVIGRKSDSDPNDPSTWGESAVICDPWNETNPFYSAAEYRTKLKNYYFDVYENQHKLFDYQDNFELEPIMNFSYDFLKQCESIDELLENFLQKLGQLLIEFNSNVDKYKNYIANQGNLKPVIKQKIIEEKTHEFVFFKQNSAQLQSQLRKKIQSGECSYNDAKEKLQQFLVDFHYQSMELTKLEVKKDKVPWYKALFNSKFEIEDDAELNRSPINRKTDTRKQ